MSEKCNRACWNCWYDEFCDWHPAGDEDACEEYTRIETRFDALLRAVENWNADMKDRRKIAKPIKGGGTVGQRSPDTVL